MKTCPIFHLHYQGKLVKERCFKENLAVCTLGKFSLISGLVKENFKLHFEFPRVTPQYNAICFWLKNVVYFYESRQFEPFKHIRRCLHTHIFYFMSEKEAFSSQSELQFSLITGGHIIGLHGVSIQNSRKLRETLRQITQKR